MDEVQGWWEVPSIAHFCYVFRDAFNLLYFEIGELEAAILDLQDPEMSLSLEQLIIRLLQGCFDERDVRSDNWEAKLHELFEENCDGKNPVEGASFHFLSPRLKVEVLHKLCEFRLDAEGSLDVIKDIPAESMKASCVGKDSHNHLYWYFCDERLYKEDPSIKPKKAPVPVKSVNVKNSATKNGKRATTRERKPVIVENHHKPWSIVCHNTSDWETLIKGFSKSKSAHEKELVNQVQTKYLPLLKEVVAEKDRLLRKRYLELAPKRASSRISKVQAQRKMEEQKAAEAAEAKRIQQEEEREKREAEQKKIEKDSRRKRAEEREKIIYERSIRVKQREMMRGYSTDSDSSSEETGPGESRPQRSCRSRKQSRTHEESEDSEEEIKDKEEELEDNEDEIEDNESEIGSRPRRSCRSKKKSNRQNASEDSEEELMDNKDEIEDNRNKIEDTEGEIESQPRRSCRSRKKSRRQIAFEESLGNEKELEDSEDEIESRPRRSCRSRKQSSRQNTHEESEDNEEKLEDSEDEIEDNEGEIENNDELSDEENSGDRDLHYASESAHSSKNSSRRQSVNKNSRSSSDEDSDEECSFPSKTSVPQNRGGLVRPGVVGNLYDSKCNEDVGVCKRKVSNISYNQFAGNKHFKPNEANYNVKTVNSIPTKDSNPTYYNEKNWYLKTCSKVTSSPSIIRIDFIKPPTTSQN